jgi:hypothetical protein
MTNYINAPNDLAIITALQSWITATLGLSLAQVVEAHDNLVAPPLDPFVIMTHLTRVPISTPWLTGTDTQVPATETATVNLGISYEYQLDAYGATAADAIMTLHVLFRSDPTSEWFQAYGLANSITIDALDADPPTHTAIINSENQYEERWTLRLRLNVVEAISTPINFMGSAVVKPLVNVSTLPR